MDATWQSFGRMEKGFSYWWGLARSLFVFHIGCSALLVDASPGLPDDNFINCDDSAYHLGEHPVVNPEKRRFK
jgi:hypothetical protein